MEDIDGGLHPAEDGQSLDKDEDEQKHRCNDSNKNMTLDAVIDSSKA